MVLTKSKKITAALIIGAALFSSCNKKGNSKRFQTDKPREPLAEYTAENPGEWEGMQAEHAPQVEYYDDRDVHNIIIRVKFPVKHDISHYIQKIGVMSPEGDDIMVQNYNPDADYFDARFTLPYVKGGVGYKAFARCSQHDLWTAPIE